MSERLALLLATVCLLLAVPVRAQDTASLRARMDTLDRRILAAEMAVRERRAAEQRALEGEVQVPLDTAVIGPFTVIAAERDFPVFSAEFRAAWAELAPVVGDVAPRVPGRTFLVNGWRRVPLFDRMMPRRAHRVVRLRAPFSRTEGVERARAALAETLSSLVPPDFRRWAGGAYFRQAPAWSGVYRSLATATSPPARACFVGDEHACADALFQPADTASRGLPVRARTALVQLALARGGEGSFARLVRDSTASPRDRLAAAAGIPFEQLVREWRVQVFRARPNARAGLGSSLLGVLLGSIVFVFLATRSTRCRTG